MIFVKKVYDICKKRFVLKNRSKKMIFKELLQDIKKWLI